MQTNCEQIKIEWEEITRLKDALVLEYEKVKEKGDLAGIKELKKELEEKRDALMEKLWVFEGISQREVKAQYESQKEIMERAGIIEELSTGEKGIKGIDGREYRFPEFREITKMMREQKEFLRVKIEQGLGQLLITPFGMSLDELIEKYKDLLWKHYKEKSFLGQWEMKKKSQNFQMICRLEKML